MDYVIIGFIAIMTSLSGSAIFYMLSKMFNNSIWEVAAKKEIAHAVSSAVILFFLISAVQQLTTIEKAIMKDLYVKSYEKIGYLWYEEYDINSEKYVMKQLLPNEFDKSDTTPAYLVTLYLKALLTKLETSGEVLYTIDGGLKCLAGGVSIDVFMNTPKNAGGALLSDIISITTSLLDNIYFFYLFYRFLIYIILFMDACALNLLLPAGIVLRCFPPTRGAGAFILSIAIGIYLVFPMAYAVVSFTTTDHTIFEEDIMKMPYLESWNTHVNVGFLGWAKLYIGAFKKDIFLLISHVASIVDVIMRNVCLFPFVAIALTITTIHALNQLLGANIPEVGRGLVKFL